MGEPKTPGLKELRIKIEQYLNSTVRAEKIFYNVHMPISVKGEMERKEWLAIHKCIWSEDSPFRAEVDKLCPTSNDKRALQEVIQRKASYWYSAVTIGLPGFSPGIEKREFERLWSDLERHEAAVGNTERVKILQELKPEHYSVRHAIAYEIKRLSQMRLSYSPRKEYFNTNNPKEVNKELLNNALYAIENVAGKYEKKIRNNELISDSKITIEELEQITKTEKKRETLWHELRTKGASFSPEKMERLAELERSPFNLRSDMIGIIELGRINKELGIIKERADEIFPEYAQLCEYLQRNEMEIQNRSLKEWDNLADTLRNMNDRLINKENKIVDKAFKEKIQVITDREK